MTADGWPWLKPVPTGCSASILQRVWSGLRRRCIYSPTHTTFVRFTHVHGFYAQVSIEYISRDSREVEGKESKPTGTGLKVPYCHKKGPFSCNKPSKLESPGPPFSQMVISSDANGLLEGKNQKNSEPDAGDLDIGRRPA